ncbi:MAG: NTP transferase domain-containing protein [Acidobacteriota bacterium]
MTAAGPLGAAGEATQDRRIAGGGILAAGQGSRLRGDGYRVAKPLVPIGGVPLVEHAITNFAAAGIAPLSIIFNESEDNCVRFVRGRFPPVASGIVVRTTASTLESFREVSARIPRGRMLLATVDAWCPREEFLRFCREAAALAPEETAVAMSSPAGDERPLRVRLDPFDPGGRIAEIGGETGEGVTAGIYLVSDRARRAEAPAGVDRLRGLLRWLVQTGEPMRAIPVEGVVDVDRGRDVLLADALAGRASAGVRS